MVSHTTHLQEAGVWALRVGCAAVVLQAAIGIIVSPQKTRLKFSGYTISNVVTNLIAIIGTPIALALFIDSVKMAMALSAACSVFYLAWAFLISVRLQHVLYKCSQSSSPRY